MVSKVEHKAVLAVAAVFDWINEKASDRGIVEKEDGLSCVMYKANYMDFVWM